MPFFSAVVLLLVAAAAWGGALILRRYALKKDMIDVPGERSSHTSPTPRGGGLPAAAAWLISIAVFAWWGELELTVAAGLIGGGGLCLLCGWLEDRYGLPIFLRFSLHVAAALCLLWSLGGLPVLRMGTASLALGWLGWPLAVLGLVWFINLFNFMDGIDGIAGIETLMGAGALGLFFWISGGYAPALVAWSLAAAAGGFLFVNWPPAKIFMGDVGSYTFGFGLAALALLGERQGSVPLLVSATFLLLFLADATFTLLRRLLRGEKVYLPHRSHYYQRATRTGLSHGQVNWLVICLNLALFALAFAGFTWPGGSPLCLLLGFVPLLVAAKWIQHRERRINSTAARDDNSN